MTDDPDGDAPATVPAADFLLYLTADREYVPLHGGRQRREQRQRDTGATPGGGASGGDSRPLPGPAGVWVEGRQP